MTSQAPEDRQYTYSEREAAAFLRVRDEHGQLSNMAGGMPVQFGGRSYQSSEGLYQALKFSSDPDVQNRIANAPNAMAAKRVAEHSPGYKSGDYDAMRLALAEKLRQHPDRFGAALLQTGSAPIVEKSFRDTYWGARPDNRGNLVGQNYLGRLLTELRDLLKQHGDPEAAARAYLGAPLEPVPEVVVPLVRAPIQAPLPTV